MMVLLSTFPPCVLTAVASLTSNYAASFVACLFFSSCSAHICYLQVLYSGFPPFQQSYSLPTDLLPTPPSTIPCCFFAYLLDVLGYCISILLSLFPPCAPAAFASTVDSSDLSSSAALLIACSFVPSCSSYFCVSASALRRVSTAQSQQGCQPHLRNLTPVHKGCNPN